MVTFDITNEISKLFTGVCTIYNTVSSTDEYGITRQEFIAVYEEVPCRLSQKSNSLASGEDVGKVTQEIKLFLLNDIEVKAGSRIKVTQNGFTRDYKYTGVANIYSNHQELVMEVSNYV